MHALRTQRHSFCLSTLAMGASDRRLVIVAGLASGRLANRLFRETCVSVGDDTKLKLTFWRSLTSIWLRLATSTDASLRVVLGEP